MWLYDLVRPVCWHCNGRGGFMDGYFEPEFSGCQCCNPDEENEDKITRVWRWRWWIFRYKMWRADRWIDKQMAKIEREEKGTYQ